MRILSCVRRIYHIGRWEVPEFSWWQRPPYITTSTISGDYPLLLAYEHFYIPFTMVLVNTSPFLQKANSGMHYIRKPSLDRFPSFSSALRVGGPDSYFISPNAFSFSRDEFLVLLLFPHTSRGNYAMTPRSPLLINDLLSALREISRSEFGDWRGLLCVLLKRILLTEFLNVLPWSNRNARSIWNILDFLLICENPEYSRYSWASM